VRQNKPSEQEQTDRDAAKAALHQLIDDLPFTADDLVFITVIVNGFWSVPPAALFQQLRDRHEQPTPTSSKRTVGDMLDFFAANCADKPSALKAINQARAHYGYTPVGAPTEDAVAGDPSAHPADEAAASESPGERLPVSKRVRAWLASLFC
jgi:hypothetical protein